MKIDGLKKQSPAKVFTGKYTVRWPSPGRENGRKTELFRRDLCQYLGYHHCQPKFFKHISQVSRINIWQVKIKLQPQPISSQIHFYFLKVVAPLPSLTRFLKRYPSFPVFTLQCSMDEMGLHYIHFRVLKFSSMKSLKTGA